LIGIAVSWIFSVYTYTRFRSFEKRWKILCGESTGAHLENLLFEHFEERAAVNISLGSIHERVESLEELMKGSKRFLGLVRFDAFPDVAGTQSFALAVFDDMGDGAILSSIVGRNSCRVYCKPLMAGRSERDLSQEEQRAVRSAKEGGSRMILSP
jgi:hypothetical protein